MASRRALWSSLLLIASCGGGSDAPSGGPNGPSVPSVTSVRSGLEHPWGLAFLPDGAMLVTERPGRLRRVGPDGSTLSPPIDGLPGIAAGDGQHGLLDVAVDPDFVANRRVYLSYVERDGTLNGTAVARATLSADHARLDGLAVIFRQSPKLDGEAHFGSRLQFARDGTLFVTLGERQRRDEAQDRANHLGKIVRITVDGAAPTDNPYAADPAAAPEVWSLGHRNVQGAALHPDTGELWVSEHGPQGGDEINRVLPGRNYGWPVITHGCEYDTCAPIGVGKALPGMEPPLAWWGPPSIAPAGMAFHTDERFPQWRGNLFVGALAGTALWRLQLDGNRVVAREPLLADLGERIRDVQQGPDGRLYLLTDSANGRILRVEP